MSAGSTQYVTKHSCVLAWDLGIDPSMMEKQVEKTTEHEIETGMIRRFRVSKLRRILGNTDVHGY